MKKKRNWFLLVLLIAVLIMSVGYSLYESNMTLNGTASIIGEWNVKITNIEVSKIEGSPNPGIPTYTNTSVTFDAKLNKLGDEVDYLITIENQGSIEAKLDNVVFKTDEFGSDAIFYETSELKNYLKPGEKTSFTVKVMYQKELNGEESKTKSITGIIEYVQK